MPRRKVQQKNAPEADNISANNLPAETVNQIVKTKRKRNRPDLANFGEEYVEPGDNSRFLRMARVSMNLPPIDISDPRQVEHRINEYFDFCEQNDRKPSMIGMCNWLGVDRTTVALWKRGDYRKETHFDVIKKAVDLLEELWTDYMQNGKINPTSGIFIAKNVFQYRDVQDVVVTPNTPLDSIDRTESRKRLTSAIPNDE